MENEIKEENNPLILEELMKLFSYYPKNKKFESKNNEIADNANFSLIFPIFLKFIRLYDLSFTDYINKSNLSKKYDFLNDEIRNYLSKMLKENDKELDEYLGEIWIKQEKYNKRHTCLFLILADKYLQNPSYTLFSEYDKNILYWTILFHDIGKHIYMNPIIKEKNIKNMADKTHPFKSIIIFLNIIFEKNLFFYPNENYKNELINIFKNEFSISLYKSWKLEKFKNKKIYNISFIYIEVFEKFFNKIKEEEKNEWIYDICILIIFHQSLPNNDKRMNNPLLEDKYIKIFFTKRLIELMRIIMIYDSSSHSLFSGGSWTYQINKHIDEVLKLFD